MQQLTCVDGSIAQSYRSVGLALTVVQDLSCQSGGSQRCPVAFGHIHGVAWASMIVVFIWHLQHSLVVLLKRVLLRAKLTLISTHWSGVLVGDCVILGRIAITSFHVENHHRAEI